MTTHSAQGHTVVTRQRNGKNGIGVETVEEQYARHTASDTAPGSGWQSTPPTLTSTYKYLWNRERILFTDGTYGKWTTPACIGSLGTDGTAIVRVTEHYLITATEYSGTNTPPTTDGAHGTWTTDPGEAKPTKAMPYLWNYETIHYSNGITSTNADTTPALIGKYSEDGEIYRIQIMTATAYVDNTDVPHLALTWRVYKNKGGTEIPISVNQGSHQIKLTNQSDSEWTSAGDDSLYTLDDDGLCDSTTYTALGKPAGVDIRYRENDNTLATANIQFSVYGTSMEAQYSPNNNPTAAQIHATFQTGDKYMRTRVTGGSWSSWQKIVGENGKETDYTFNISQSLTSTNASTAPDNCYLNEWSDAPIETTAEYPYMWAKVQQKNESGVVTSTRYIRLTGEQGAAGTSVEAQYAPNNNPTAAQIHATFQTGDKYMRTRASNETNWSAWQLIVGENGTAGAYTNYKFGISAQLTTASTTTAPTIYGTWSDAPKAVTNDYPYLWCSMQRVVPNSSGGSTYGTVYYIRLTGEKGANGTSVSIKGRVHEWHDDTTGYDKVDALVWAINTPHGIYYWSEEMDQYVTVTPSAGDGYIVDDPIDQDYAYNGHLLVSNGTAWIDAGQIKGDPGEAGQKAYMHIAYANKDANGNIIDFTDDDEGSAGRAYMGTYADYTEADAPSDSILWKWQRIKGNDSLTIYKNAFRQPSTPLPSTYAANGWTKAPATQPKIGISHGGAWTQIADGSWQSPETGSNEAFEERFEILTTAANQELSMEIRASSEVNYDKAYIGQLDSTDPYTNQLATVSGTQKSAVSVNIATAGKHFIIVSYKKNGSGVANEDCARLKIGRMPTWMSSATNFDADGNPTEFSTPIPITDTKAQGDTTTAKDNILKQTRFRNTQRMAAWETTAGTINSGIGNNNSYYGVNENTDGTYLELLQFKLSQVGAFSHLKNSTWYTLSFWAKGTILHTYIYPSAIDTSADFIVDGVKQTSRPGDGHVQWTLNATSWRRHTVTFKTQGAYSTTQPFAADEHLLFRLMSQNNYASILMPKLEEGEQATTYQMNEEDIEGLTGKMLYPAGTYSSDTNYESDEYSTPLVNISGTNDYYWLNADSSQGENPATSYKWRKANYFQVILTQALVASFGKVGAAVFINNFIISQYGKINGTQVNTYQHFDENNPNAENDTEAFAPNLFLNLLTGAARLAAGNAMFAADGTVDITGTIRAARGNIGGFDISSYDLKTNNNAYYVKNKRGIFLRAYSDSQIGCMTTRHNTYDDGININGWLNVADRANMNGKVNLNAGVRVTNGNYTTSGTAIANTDTIAVLTPTADDAIFYLPRTYGSVTDDANPRFLLIINNSNYRPYIQRRQVTGSGYHQIRWKGTDYDKMRIGRWTSVILCYTGGKWHAMNTDNDLSFSS